MEYQVTFISVIDAVKNELSGVNNWHTAGSNVREFFGTEAALLEVKAQFIADAIIPAMDKKYAQALALELPRKGSKDYNALDESGRARWDDANEAKKSARAVSHTMFNRVAGYAFPKEKAEGGTKTLKTRLVDMLSDAIGKIEKAEAPDFDAPAALAKLREAVAIIAK